MADGPTVTIANKTYFAAPVIPMNSDGTAQGTSSFNIPPFDYQAFTYVGATNNVATQVFKTGGSGGTTVATLTFAYVAAGAADNDKISSITKT